MKELLKLAEEKGWKAKTVSTKWTVDCLLGRKKRAFLNEYCESNVLNEIQKWLRDFHKISIEIESMWNDEDRIEICYVPWISYSKEEEDLGFEDEDATYFENYEEAQIVVLTRALNENI